MEKKLLSVICVGLIIISVLVIFSNNNLSKENKILKQNNEILTKNIEYYELEAKELKLMISDLTTERDDLTQTKVKLEENNQELEQTNNELGTELNNVKDEVKSTISEIEYFENEIDKSMQWFNTNSKIENIRVKRYLESDCYRVRAKDCIIKLSCIDFTNSERLQYHYIYDTETSGTTDKLQSIQEFYDNNGGDCEDYSLFYKAEYNFLAEQCMGKDIKLETWVPGEGEYFVQFDEVWYLENAEAYYLEEGFVHPMIICGNMYDPNTNTVNGHCLLGFSKEKITDSSQLKNLVVPLVEPQNGLYSGTADLSGSSEVHQIITDDDMFLYRNTEWMSYSKFKNTLEEQKEELKTLI